MASAFNVTGLSEYVNQRTDELLTKAVLEGNTLNYIDTMLNVKFKDALNYLDSSVVFGDASTCGWDPQGADTFTQRYIEVSPIKINKEWCARDLRKYWMNYQLNFAAGRETLPFEETLVNNNIKAINAELEKQIWQADSSAGSELFDGLISFIDASTSTVVDASTAAESIDAAYAALSDAAFAMGDVVIFVSPATFRGYIAGLNATCCANRPVMDANTAEVVYPGDSRVRIVPTAGLIGAEFGGDDLYAVASPAKNLVFGTDIENSENMFKLIPDEKTDMIYFKVLFNAGTQIKFPDLVVAVTE